MIRKVRAITFDDILGIELIHNLEFEGDLFPGAWFDVYTHDLTQLDR